MPITRRAAVAGLAAMPLAGWAQAAPPPEVAAELPGARLQGQGRLTYLGFHVYDARLWVGEGFDAAQWARRPLALEIEYSRALPGIRIADRGLDEMKRSGPLDDALAERWRAVLRGLFPDVERGDRLAAVQRPGDGMTVYRNAKRLGDVREAAFVERFFGIWLAPMSSEPALRRALLGFRGDAP